MTAQKFKSLDVLITEIPLADNFLLSVFFLAENAEE